MLIILATMSAFNSFESVVTWNSPSKSSHIDQFAADSSVASPVQWKTEIYRASE
jgi:hypothetical protein